jgi:NAD(P)-dependent dehydrogenase (short-subunit alcohol dehydrogenase family)
MNCIIVGDKSDIAQGLKHFLTLDGWNVSGWSRNAAIPTVKWDLLLITLGRVSPVGWWWDTFRENWDKCIYSNLITPLMMLGYLWEQRNPESSVCFMAGSNPQKIMAGYSAYNSGKMALLKLCEQLDAESFSVKFFALGPGYVDTKIHGPTKKANWPNERILKGNPTPIDRIYDCLKWCVSQPKEVVGGRNICVSDPWGPELAERLKANPNLYKLRRVE